MKTENKQLIREAVKKTGESISSKLLPTPEHPIRNPWAHVWREIKLQMGKSYIDCDDEDVPLILEIIENAGRETQ